MQVLKYNGKCYLRINDNKLLIITVGKYKTDSDIEVINFTKDAPYILDLAFYRYEFEKLKEVIKGYTISKTN